MSTTPTAVDWDRLAVEFSLAWDADHDLVAALKRTFAAARYAPPTEVPAAAAVVIAEAAQAHGLEVADVMFAGKSSEVVAARDEAMSRLWNGGAGISYSAIGRLFRKDHTTAMAAVARHRARVGRGLEAVKAAA